MKLILDWIQYFCNGNLVLKLYGLHYMHQLWKYCFKIITLSQGIRLLRLTTFCDCKKITLTDNCIGAKLNLKKDVLNLHPSCDKFGNQPQIQRGSITGLLSWGAPPEHLLGCFNAEWKSQRVSRRWWFNCFHHQIIKRPFFFSDFSRSKNPLL